MITDTQLNILEGCARMLIQKIVAARNADKNLRSGIRNPGFYSSAWLRDAEKIGRHADSVLNAAIDELYDELAKLRKGAMAELPTGD